MEDSRARHAVGIVERHADEGASAGEIERALAEVQRKEKGDSVSEIVPLTLSDFFRSGRRPRPPRPRGTKHASGSAPDLPSAHTFRVPSHLQVRRVVF